MGVVLHLSGNATRCALWWARLGMCGRSPGPFTLMGGGFSVAVQQTSSRSTVVEPLIPSPSDALLQLVSEPRDVSNEFGEFN